MLRVASVRLGINSESQALVTYRAMANVMNRFGEMDRFEAAIEELSADPTEDFLRYGGAWYPVPSCRLDLGNEAITDQIRKLVHHQISALLDEHGLHPIPKH